MSVRVEESDPPSISVIICAYTEERWEALVAAVESVRCQTLPARELIVVVDHNDGLLRRARDTFAHAVVLENLGAQGLSSARNYGVAKAQGTIVAFLDDDAEAASDWLAWLAHGFRDRNVLGVGGSIEPVWLDGRPRWFPAELQWVVGCTYRGMPDVPTAVRNMIGANMSCRRELFEQVGGFRDDLARVGERPFGCEESEWCIRARQHRPDGSFLYEPRAKVRHRVPAKRARFSYLRSQCYAEGLGKAMISRLLGFSNGTAAERSYVLRTLPSGVLQNLAKAAGGDVAGLGRAGTLLAGTAFAAAGYLRGMIAARHLPPSATPRAVREPELGGNADDPCTRAPAHHGPVKVLVVTARYFPLAGGTETHVYEVSRRLAQAGATVTVLTTDPDGSLPEREVQGGVLIRRVRAWPANRDYYFAPGIYDIITKGQWDIVHCQSIHTLVAPLAMFAAWRAKIPFIVTSHTGGHSSRFRNAIRGAQWLALRPLIARASRLVTVSDFEAAYFQKLLRLPADNVVVIQNGAQLPPVFGAQSGADEGPVIVSVGRLERYKGHHRAIQALPKVLAQEPGTRLKIIGAGPYESPLRRMADELGVGDQVEIRSVPADRREEMAAIVGRADLFTLLSDYEAHPVAVMEALSLGRSALVTDTSGLRELADRGLVRMVPLHSKPVQIADAMVEQLRSPLVPHGVELPTWDGCSAALQDLYRKVIGESQCAS